METVQVESFRQKVLASVKDLARGSSSLAGSPEGSAALKALCDIRDADIRALWAWLAALSEDEPQHNIGFPFVYAVLTGAHYRKLRASVQGYSKGEFDEHPSRLIRVVGTRRKGGDQTDFLRTLGATLMDFHFNIGASGTQTHVLHIAQKVLEDKGVGLTANTVSKVWTEIREDDRAARR